MSDKVIDLKQATLASLAGHLRDMTQAIVASNNRYLALTTRVDEGFRRMDDRFKDLERRINDAHSEVIGEANKIITLQDQMWQFLLAHSDKPEGG